MLPGDVNSRVWCAYRSVEKGITDNGEVETWLLGKMQRSWHRGDDNKERFHRIEPTIFDTIFRFRSRMNETFYLETRSRRGKLCIWFQVIYRPLEISIFIFISYHEREDQCSLTFLLIINYYYSRLNGSGSRSRSTRARASIIASLDFFHFANFQPNYPATINFSDEQRHIVFSIGVSYAWLRWLNC